MKIKTSIENLGNYQIYLKVEEAAHDFFRKKKYLKVDLPVLSPALIPESYLKVFQTEFSHLDRREKLYLTPSPELFLKRLLAHGIGNCYYLGKSFRNSDPPTSLHHYEFTMLEFYKIGATYLDLAEIVLELLRHIAYHVYPTKAKVDHYRRYFRKWRWLTVAQAFHLYAGITQEELFDKKKFLTCAEKKGYKIKSFSFEDIFSQIYTQEVEPKLSGVTLIYDYPKEFAALAKPNPDGKTAQRFEFYLNGIEIGDCYSELTDWQEQLARFKKEKVDHPIDTGFIETLQYGLADCSGIAIGFDRLAMFFAGVDSIDKLKLINIV